MTSEIERIAAELHPDDRACLLDDDPHHVRGSVASMMSLCLADLAEPKPDNGIALTPLGKQVRAHLEQHHAKD